MSCQTRGVRLVGAAELLSLAQKIGGDFRSAIRAGPQLLRTAGVREIVRRSELASDFTTDMLADVGCVALTVARAAIPPDVELVST